MKNYSVAFNFLDRDNHAPFGYKEITCHLIFDVKIELTSKARYVVGVHITNPPLSMIYVVVVSYDIVRQTLLISELDDLYILAGDIQNTYLNASTKEKVFSTLAMSGNLMICLFLTKTLKITWPR